MTALAINLDGLDADEVADLESAADALAVPEDHNRDWEGRWSRSFRALDALRVLINTLTFHDVLRWADGTSAGVTASFDSDGDLTDTEFTNISVLLPTPPLTGRFGVFVTVLVGEIDDLLPASARTASTCAEAVAKALSEAVVDARMVAA